MPRKIIVLEDNGERQRAMRQCLENSFLQWEILFFDEVQTLKKFLEEQLTEAAIICLDHDLEMKTDSEGKTVDPGTGREVADFLASKKPVCPVVIHTTNSIAAVGMEMVLQEANWTISRVCPWGDLDWIPTEWFPLVGRLLGCPIKKRKRSNL